MSNCLGLVGIPELPGPSRPAAKLTLRTGRSVLPLWNSELGLSLPWAMTLTVTVCPRHGVHPLLLLTHLGISETDGPVFPSAPKA